MFCSNCGKTIRPESDTCQHCGANLGTDRFYGNAYTSSQVRIPAEQLNQAPTGGMLTYTRTSYMTDDIQPENDVYSNTTYRPLLSEEETAVYKRGRNSHVHGIPAHANPGEYHSATGLEALFGWLYLSGEQKRIKELFLMILDGISNEKEIIPDSEDKTVF